jgi:hypothetical protein
LLQYSGAWILVLFHKDFQNKIRPSVGRMMELQSEQRSLTLFRVKITLK